MTILDPHLLGALTLTLAAEPSLDELQRIYDQRSHIPARFHDLTQSPPSNNRPTFNRDTMRLLMRNHELHVRPAPQPRV